MLRLVRKHPIAGLLLGLSMEAWLVVPGEALIAIAASAIARTRSLLSMFASGLGGMLLNDLVLYGLSRVGRGVLVTWIGLHRPRFHLSPQLVMGAKFLPPLRSAAYLIYGLQGAPFLRFLWVSLLSSLLWIGLYTLLGLCFRQGIRNGLDGLAHKGGRWVSWAEVAFTVAAVVCIWL